MARCGCSWSYGKRLKVCGTHRRKGLKPGSKNTLRKSRAKFAVTAKPVETAKSKPRRARRAAKGGDA